MTKIRVDTAGVSSIWQMVSSLNEQMNLTEEQLRYARRNIDMQVSATEQINYRLQKIQNRIDNQQNKLHQYMVSLDAVNEKFAATDSKIANEARDVHYLLDRLNQLNLIESIKQLGDRNNSNLKIFTERDKTKEFLDVLMSEDVQGKHTQTLIDMFGEFGTIGALTAIVSTCATNDNMIKKGKALMKGVGLVTKWAGKIVDGKTIDLLGTSTVDAIGFAENLAKKVDGYKLNSTSNIANMSDGAKSWRNAGVIAKWGGVALTALDKFMGNAEEFDNDFSNVRMYEETVLETAVDVGLGVVVGAAVGALAGATAPVWAVGVVSGAAVIGINAASEAILGADLAEAVTDLALNTRDMLRDADKAVMTKIGDGISSGLKSIATGWRSVFS